MKENDKKDARMPGYVHLGAMLEQYRAGERGLPTYEELSAIATSAATSGDAPDLQQLKAPALAGLRAAILSLPCEASPALGSIAVHSYKRGHSEAREAAAELVARIERTAAPTDAEARRVALNLKPAATPEEIAHFIAHWQAGHEGKGIDPTTRGHALAAYAEGIKAREMAQRAAAPTDAAHKMIERAIIGLRDGWATRKDADEALAALSQRAAAPVTGRELPPFPPILDGHRADAYEPNVIVLDIERVRKYAEAYARAAVSASQAAPTGADREKLRELAEAYRIAPLQFKTGERMPTDIALDAIVGYIASARPSDDHLWDQTIRDRDQNADWADKLADAIAEHFGAYIGEHSNMNCPWSEALDVIEAAAPVASQAAPVGGELPSIDVAEFRERLRGLAGRIDVHSDQYKQFVGCINRHVSAAVAAANVQTGEDTVIARLPEIHKRLIAAYTAGALRNSPNGIDADAYAEAERIMRAWDLPDAAPVEQGQGAVGWVDDGGMVFWTDGKPPADGSNLYAAPVGAGVVPEGLRDQIRNAVITVGHSIEDNAVTLYRDPRNKGGAFSQLLDRIEIALAGATPTAATAHPVAADDQVRDQALEEAAKTAEATRVATVQYGLSLFQDGDGTRRDIAEAIRAKKSTSRTTAHGGAQGEQA